MVWEVIATVAASISAVAALIAVRQTIAYRRDELRRNLADALITIISAYQSSDPGADERLQEGLRQVERVGALWIVGLSGELTQDIFDLMDPPIRSDPRRAFMLATRAFAALGGKDVAGRPLPSRLDRLLRRGRGRG